MIEGLLEALQPINLFFLVLGAAGGVIIGGLPGLTGTMGMALLIPFTFVMDPATGLILLGALLTGAVYGDAVPAILINVPGTPAALFTTFDGYPMAEQGRGRLALRAAAFSSAVGALVGGLALLTLSPPLATLSLAFGPPEFFWLGVFALTIMGSLVGSSFSRGLGAGLVGLLISMIGVSPAGTSRFTFGFHQLAAGIHLPVALIGLFAIPQLIRLVEGRRSGPRIVELPPDAEEGHKFSRHLKEVWRPVTLLRSSVIGVLAGILPGSGPSLAGILSYNEAVRWSRDKSQFGHGALDGVLSVESANNAAAPTGMVPLLTLGVPGSNSAAIVLGALLFHGLRPGAALFRDTPEIVYGFIWGMILAGMVILGLSVFMAPVLVRLMRAPSHLLVPAVAALAVVGSFAVRGNVFDVYLMLALGVLAYFMTRMGMPIAPIALGIILGPIVESGLVSSLNLSRSAGLMGVFVLRPISAVLILMTLASIAYVVYGRISDRSRELTGGED